MAVHLCKRRFGVAHNILKIIKESTKTYISGNICSQNEFLSENKMQHYQGYNRWMSCIFWEQQTICLSSSFLSFQCQKIKGPVLCIFQAHSSIL